MNIKAQKGDEVVCSTFDGGTLRDNADGVFAKKYLFIGAVYTIEMVDIFDWYTGITLKEFPGKRFKRYPIETAQIERSIEEAMNSMPERMEEEKDGALGVINGATIIDNVGKTLLLRNNNIFSTEGHLAACEILRITEDVMAVEIKFSGWKEPEWRELGPFVGSLSGYSLVAISF